MNCNRILLTLVCLTLGVYGEPSLASTTIFFCASDCAADPSKSPTSTTNPEVDARQAQERIRVISLASKLLPILVGHQIGSLGSQHYIGKLSNSATASTASLSIKTTLALLKKSASIGVMIAFSDIPYLDSIRKAAITHETILIIIQNSRFVPSWTPTLATEAPNLAVEGATSAELRSMLGSKEIHIVLRGDEFGYVLGKAVRQATKTSGKVAYLVSSAHEANGRGEGVAVGEVEGYFESAVQAGLLVSLSEACRQCEIQRITKDSREAMLTALDNAQALINEDNSHTNPLDFDVVVASGFVANQVARRWALDASTSQPRSIVTIGPSWLQHSEVFNNTNDLASQSLLMNLQVDYGASDIVDKIDAALSQSSATTSNQVSVQYVPASSSLLSYDDCVYSCNHSSRLSANDAVDSANSELTTLRSASSLHAGANTIGFDVLRGQLSQPSYYNVNQPTSSGNLGSSLVEQGTFFSRMKSTSRAKLSTAFATVILGTEIHVMEDYPIPSLTKTTRSPQAHHWIYHPVSDSVEWLYFNSTATSWASTSYCASDAVVLALVGSKGKDRHRTIYLHGGSNCGKDAHGSTRFQKGVRMDNGSFTFSDIVRSPGASPSARRNHVGVVLNDTALLFYGGQCLGGTCNDVWIFDTEALSWFEVKPENPALVAEGRFSGGATVWNFPATLQSKSSPAVTDVRWLIVAGGLSRTNSSISEHHTVLALGLTSWRWVDLTPTTNQYIAPSTQPCVVASGDRLTVVGGAVGVAFSLKSGGSRVPYAEVFSAATGKWATANEIQSVNWKVGRSTRCLISPFTEDPQSQDLMGGVTAVAIQAGSLRGGAVNRFDFNPVRDSCESFMKSEEAAALADGGALRRGLYYTSTSGLSCHRCSGQTYAHEEMCVSCSVRSPSLGWQKDLCAVTGTNQVFFALVATLLIQVVCYPVFFMAIRAMRLTREAAEQEAQITELAEAVAEQKFEKVAFLDRIEKRERSKTQDALIACVRNLKKYRSFIPPAILSTSDKAVSDLQCRREAGALVPGATTVEVDRRVSAIEVGANESSDDEEEYSEEDATNEGSLASGATQHSGINNSKLGNKTETDTESLGGGLSFFATRTGEIGGSDGSRGFLTTGSHLTSHDRLLVNQEIIHSLRPRLESRQGSVIVANIVGFQTWAESQRGKLIKRYIKYTETLLGEIQQFKGIVDCVVGDKVVGSFNAAQACEKHQTMACWAAYDIAKNTQLQGIGLKAVVGCSSGDVLFGVVGSEKAKQSILLSTAVGEAASLCKQTQKQGVDILFPFRMEQVLDSGFVYKVVGVGLFEQPQPAASYEHDDHIGQGSDPLSAQTGGSEEPKQEIPVKRELVLELVAPSNDPMWWYERRGVKEEIESFNTAMRLVFLGKVNKAAQMPLSQLPEWDVQVVETVIRERQLPSLKVECRW